MEHKRIHYAHTSPTTDEYGRILPVCDECEEPITDEYFYNIDEVYYCEECMETFYRVSVESWQDSYESQCLEQNCK